MSETYIPESRWRLVVAALLVGGGLLLGAVVLGRGLSSGGAEGAGPGTDMGRVAFLDVDGNRRTLAEFKGRVVLVDVWATWCPPCREALPEVAELQKASGERYLVLPISVDRGGWGDVRPFLAHNPQLGLTAFVPDGSRALEPFGAIRGIPTTLLIDRQSRLVKRWSGYGPGLAKRALEEALKTP